MDVEKGQDYNRSHGMIVSPHVQVGFLSQTIESRRLTEFKVGEAKSRLLASTNMATAAISKSVTNTKGGDDMDNVTRTSRKEIQSHSEKRVNILDWSRAKSKTGKSKEIGRH